MKIFLNDVARQQSIICAVFCMQHCSLLCNKLQRSADPDPEKQLCYSSHWKTPVLAHKIASSKNIFPRKTEICMLDHAIPLNS